MTTLQQHPRLPAAAAATATATTSSNIPSLLRPKSSGRRPLQPVNSTRSGIKVEAATKGIANVKPIKPSLPGEFGKENEVWLGNRAGDVAAKAFVVKVMEDRQEMGGALSLEEELMAARKKMERMRIDRERTEKLMGERSDVLDTKMRELDERGDVQKALEMEVDRLYRLKQLKATFTSKVSPMRSLREMEQSRKSEAAPREIKLEESPRSSVASAKSISMEE